MTVHGYRLGDEVCFREQRLTIAGFYQEIPGGSDWLLALRNADHEISLVHPTKVRRHESEVFYFENTWPARPTRRP